MKMKFSTAMFIVESSVVVIGMIILRDWSMPLYALISIFVAAQVTDFVLDGASYDKLLFIITDKNEQMKDYVMNDLKRGGTYIKSRGMYTGKDRDMIFVVVNKRQISEVQDKVKNVDPNAFVVIVNAQDTFGEGFKAFPE